MCNTIRIVINQDEKAIKREMTSKLVFNHVKVRYDFSRPIAAV